ncbi:MAG: Uma2 family endonuclease [Acidimicrobiales bacterium]
MKAVILDVDQRTLAERAQLGLDVRDEMWEGVLHMVPQPISRHQELESELLQAFGPIVRTRGLRVAPELAVFAGEHDYRVPDVAVYSTEARGIRGVTGTAALVVEIRSPGDETYEKLPWYLAGRAEAVLIVDRDSLAVELYTADGRLPNDSDGGVVVESLGVAIVPDAGTLRVGDRLLDI